MIHQMLSVRKHALLLNLSFSNFEKLKKGGNYYFGERVRETFLHEVDDIIRLTIYFGSFI
jgi:hypothetical protein